jgi:hypothetical protein
MLHAFSWLLNEAKTSKTHMPKKETVYPEVRLRPFAVRIRTEWPVSLPALNKVIEGQWYGGGGGDT